MSSDALSKVGMPVSLSAVAPPLGAQRSSQEGAAAVPLAVTAIEPAQSVAAVKASAQQLESYLKSNGRELQFRVDDDSGMLVVSVRDAVTGDLIRQMPGEEVLRMARALKENPVSLINLTV